MEYRTYFVGNVGIHLYGGDCPVFFVGGIFAPLFCVQTESANDVDCTFVSRFGAPAIYILAGPS